MEEFENEILDITKILTTPERDFLLRSNGDKVKVDSLKGKIIALHFLQVRRVIEYQKCCGWKVGKVIEYPRIKVAADLLDLLDAYEEHHSKGDFEVVFVAIFKEDGKGKGSFEEEEEEEAFFKQQFLRMPCLAIPFSDIDARRKLSKAFVPSSFLMDFQSSTIIDATGRLLSRRADQYLNEYASDFYPFTSQRKKEMIEENSSLWQNNDLSLQFLLAAPNRDFLISNQGTKVPITKLEGKVVGLYLYGSGSGMSLQLLPKLMYIYNELRVKRQVNFEIVLVNLHFMDYGYGDEESFNKAFGNMPWLALPFKDKMCRKLWLRYNPWGDERSDDGVFVVISSDGKSVDPYGAKVIIEYGVDAYPFTRDKAAMIEKEKLKRKRIMATIMAQKDHLIRKDGSKVHVNKIFGKNILLFVGSERVSSTLSFLPELLGWYKEIKNRDKNFEVIYLSRDQDKARFNDAFQEMPWLTFPFRSKQRNQDKATFNDVFQEMPWLALSFRSKHWLSDMLNNVEYFFSNCCYLIALGRDGRIVTKDAVKHLRSRGADAYPFTDDDLLEDVKLELATRLVWTVMDEKGNEYIPNYRPNMSAEYSRGRRRRIF